MSVPREGDKILIVKQPWLDLILTGLKTMEIRGRPLRSGWYWIGHGGKIYGRVSLDTAVRVQNKAHWQALRSMHCVEAEEPIYKKSFGLPIVEAERLPSIPYKMKKGAIGIVRFCEAP